MLQITNVLIKILNYQQKKKLIINILLRFFDKRVEN